MSNTEDKNKIIKHNKYTEAFQSSTTESKDNKQNEFEEEKSNEKRNLQIEEFSIKKNVPTRFDYAYYNKKEKEKEKKEIESRNENDNPNEDNSKVDDSIVSQSQNFRYDERLKDPIRKSYLKNKQGKVNKDSNDKYDIAQSYNKDHIEYRAYQFKVIMLGNIAVGKTCLLSYFVDSLFKDNYTCTVGVDFKVKTVVLTNNLKVDLQIWDTSGEERFRTITKQYYRDAAGIVLVFDVTNEKSFNDLTQWVDEIYSTGKRNVSIVLIGNKADLVSERVVSYERANQFASRKNIEYYEASAKTGQQVEEIYIRLSANMVNIREEEDMKMNGNEENIVLDSSRINVNDGNGKFKNDNKNLKIGSKKKNKNCCGE